MHERGKAVEGGLIESQTCEKKIYVVKKILPKIFFHMFDIQLSQLPQLSATHAIKES